MEKLDRSVQIILAEPDIKEASEISLTLQKNLNATVIYCKKGAQVLTKIESDEGAFDAVISELSLPDMPGVDIFYQMRDFHITIPFILILDIDSIHQVVTAIKTGMDGYVIKDQQKAYLDILPTVVSKEIQHKQNNICMLRTNDALRDSEEKYRSMMEAMKDPVYICSSDYDVTYMNPAMISRIGRNAIGELCYKAIHNQESPCSWCRLSNIKTNDPFEHEITSPKDKKTYSVTSSPVFHPNGTISRMFIFRDITSQKRIDEDLIALKNKAEEANIAKTEFLTNISHEIRTPLNVVLGMLDLMQTTEVNAKQKEYLDSAKTSADQLKLIIDDILDYSKIESGHMTLTKNDVNLNLLMKEIAAVKQIKCQEKNLKFSCVIDPDVPEKIYADSKRLRQILDNIIDNAIKFTEKGKIEVSVSIDKNTKSDRLHFKISDTGVGIPEDKQEVIFKGFTQVDGSVTRRHGGTGLGLAISRNLVEMMGGSIWVESSEGKGSTFHAAIPMPSQKPQPAVIAPSEEKKLRILLAEDNPFNQKLIDAILKTKGYEVSIADNGRIALELFEKKSFDLILMDIQMPELDGFQTARAIRSFEKEKGGHIPIIAITAYSMVGDKEKCLQAGMDEYLRKPIQRELLLSTIRDYAEKKIEPETPQSNNLILNRKALLEVVGNNTDLVKELIRIYFDNLPKLMNQIENGIIHQNARDIHFGAHALKGMSYNISAHQVAQAAHELEKTGRSDKLAPAKQQFQVLKQELELLKKAVDSFKNSI